MWFYCRMEQTEITAEPVQCVPRLVRFSMDPVMILSTGSVTESCVILLYCVISIVALFMCLPASLPPSQLWYSLLSD